MATKQKAPENSILPTAPVAPASATTNTDANTKNTILSAHDVVQQAAAAHAAILAPYMSSDSDDDPTLNIPPVASSSTCNNAPPPGDTGNININGNPPSTHSLPPMEPICESANNNASSVPNAQKSIPPPQGGQSSLSNGSKPEQVPASVVKSEDQVDQVVGASEGQKQPGTDVMIGGDDVLSSKAADGDNASANNTGGNINFPKSENNSDPAASADTINVSRSCLDSVLEQMANRISELENIRERKKARVERLSSAATMMAQNASAVGAAPLWPQSAALAAAQAAVAANSRGSAAINPINPINSLAAAAASNVNVNPPPPPPPPPDGGERKQSRYWTADEHERFLAAIKSCGPKNYVRIAELVGTRNAKQVRTHAQKFQKKLEREEAKRQEDIRRHGGAATSVSAAAVAAVAAAAAAMHQNGHLSAADAAAAPVLGAYAVQHPHLLLPYNHPTMAARTNSLLAMYAGAQAAQHGMAPPTALLPVPVTHPHSAIVASQPQPQVPVSMTMPIPMAAQAPPEAVVDSTSSPAPANMEAPVAPETVAAAVAAEVAALGRSVYSGKPASPTASAAAGVVPVVAPVVAPMAAPGSNEAGIVNVNAESGESESKGESKPE